MIIDFVDTTAIAKFCNFFSILLLDLLILENIKCNETFKSSDLHWKCTQRMAAIIILNDPTYSV